MFKKYFYANSNQDNTSPKFSTEVDSFAEVDSNQASDNGENERYESDNKYGADDGGPGGHSDKSKGNTYSQRIDAGSYG